MVQKALDSRGAVGDVSRSVATVPVFVVFEVMVRHLLRYVAVVRCQRTTPGEVIVDGLVDAFFGQMFRFLGALGSLQVTLVSGQRRASQHSVQLVGQLPRVRTVFLFIRWVGLSAYRPISTKHEQSTGKRSIFIAHDVQCG